MKFAHLIKVIAAAAVTGIVVLTGCAAPPTSQPTTTTTTTVPTTTSSPPPTSTTTTPSGPYGKLKIALSTFGNEKMDPTTADSTFAADVLSSMFDFMLWVSDSPSGAAVTPRVIEKWEVAPDGLSTTYFVRKGIKFSDGSDLTAADVKFSIERYMSPTAYRAFLAQNVKSVDLVDTYTLRINTKAANYFIFQGNSPTSPAQGEVMPKAYIEKNGVPYFMAHPVGSGPWKLIRYTPADTYQFEAVPSHWLQTPAFKNLDLILIPEEATRIALLKTGETDITPISLTSVTEVEAAGFRTASMGYYAQQVQLHGVYDTRSAGLPTNDIRVRQALSMAIDRSALLTGFYLNKGQAALPPDLTPGADDVDLAYWRDYLKTAYKYDVDGAKKLLSDAGYPQGFSIKLYTFTGRATPFMPQLAVVIQSYWSAVGVKANLINIDSGTYNTWRLQPSQELVGNATTYWSSPNFTIPNLIADFTSSGTGVFFGKGTPQATEFDKLIAAASAEPDVTKRKALYVQMIKLSVDSYTIIALAQAPGMFAMGNGITADFPPTFPTPSATILSNIIKHKTK